MAACDKEKTDWTNAENHVTNLINAGASPQEIKAAKAVADSLHTIYLNCLRNPPLPAPTHIKGQCQASVGEWTYWFVVDSEGRILYNKWKYGGAGLGWHEIPGDARSDIAPAAAIIKPNDYYIYLTIMDRNGNLLLNQGGPGQNPENADTWVGWR